jgi:hypothetical protein
LGKPTDGASVIVGKNSSVVTRLRQKYPTIVAWHYFNHSLELSISATIKYVRGIDYFKFCIYMLQKHTQEFFIGGQNFLFYLFFNYNYSLTQYQQITVNIL